MRSHWWLSLVAMVLLASILRVSFSRPRPTGEAPQPRPPRNLAQVDRGEDVVDGYGPNAAAARDRALEHAQERVEKLLRAAAFGSAAGGSLAEQLLTLEYLVRYGVVQAAGRAGAGERLDEDRAMVARYKVELTREYLSEVQRVAREQRVEERHKLLARVLAGLVVVLLVAAGYLRLEDMTRGYATQLLRMSAFTLLALAAAALWLTW